MNNTITNKDTSRWVFILILCFFKSYTLFAQAIQVNLSQLSFLKGTWTVKHLWGDMEEIWGPPIGNCMVSSYRCVKDGKVLFYEFVVIEQEKEVPVMKMRHFNAGNIGLEDKGSPLILPLVYCEKNKATFANKVKSIQLSYTLVDPTHLQVSLAEKNKNGKMQNIAFDYTLESR